MTVDSFKNPRVLLVRAPVNAPRLIFPDNPWVGIPIGLLYLHSALKKAGVKDLEILDAMALPDFSKVHRADSDGRFGLSDSEFKERVRKFNPDLICFSVVANRFLTDTQKAARLVREVLPNVKIIAGGHDVTARPQEYLYSDVQWDAVVVGEGEEVVVDLVQRMRAGEPWATAKGIALLDQDGQMVKTQARAIEDLDQYKLDFNSIDLEKYFELYRQGFGGRKTLALKGSDRAVFIVTSRGCPYKCTFCSIYQTMGRRMRYHGVEYVLELIQRLVKQYGVNHIHFEDDHLTANKERFKKILRGILELKLNITWDTPNGVRADSFDEEMLLLCKQSGCVYLTFGVESGDQGVLDSIVDKQLDLKRLEKTLTICKKIGLDTMAFLIIGMPGETKAQILKTYRYAFRLLFKFRTVPFISLFKPFIDTPLYQTSKKQNYLIDFDKESKRRDIPDMLFTPLMIETPEFKTNFLIDVVDRYIFFFSILGVLNWMLTTFKRPILATRLIARYLRDLLRAPKQVRRISYDFFWGTILYPRAVLRFRNRMFRKAA